MQELINIRNVMSIWIEHITAFVNDSPEIAIVYTKMPVNEDDLAYAIPIQLSTPVARENYCREFNFSFPERSMTEGAYQELAFFIDWLPSSTCPEPIKLLFPESIV